jgi:hypothetical protein
MISFLIGFLVLCCVLACLIILVRWLLALAGFAIPQPLLVVAGIILFVICFLWLLSWAHVYTFQLGR